MKVFIALAVLIAVAVAAPPPSSSKDAVILKYDNDNDNIQGYNYAVETSDGFSKQESAVVENLGSENESLKVSGTFSYTDLEGKTYTVQYTADENGFVASGEHIPKN